MGTLRCILNDDNRDFKIELAPAEVRVGTCAYKVRFRDQELVKASIKPSCVMPTVWTEGEDFVLNMDFGAGSFSDARDWRQQANFQCREVR